MIPAYCPRIFRFFNVFFGFGQEPDICKGGGKVENCLHDSSTLSQNPFCFLGFGQNAAKLGVCKTQRSQGPFLF